MVLQLSSSPVQWPVHPRNLRLQECKWLEKKPAFKLYYFFFACSVCNFHIYHIGEKNIQQTMLHTHLDAEYVLVKATLTQIAIDVTSQTSALLFLLTEVAWVCSL